MTKWEYWTFHMPAHVEKDEERAELRESLNAIGDQGWELVSVVPISRGSSDWSAGRTDHLLYLFKRSCP